MKVQIKLTGFLAKQHRTENFVEIDDGVNVHSLLEKIFDKYKLGKVSERAGYISILINGRNPKMRSIVKEGDRVAIVPIHQGG